MRWQAFRVFPVISRSGPTPRAALEHDENTFRYWSEGQPGFPIVDAAMRQLRETGWTHSRLRMLVAMFMGKDLCINWRWGERYFMQHMLHGDLAANNGGWQWCASTGNAAAPYVRVFHPTLQSQKLDADGNFIRRYVPELRALDNKRIHAPPGWADRSFQQLSETDGCSCRGQGLCGDAAA